MGQGAQCSVIFKKLCPYSVVSVDFPSTLTTQVLGDICVTHQAQVTHRGLSYESINFSSVTVPGETLCCSKRFLVVRGEGPAEGLFEKYPDPPPPGI